MKQWKKKAMALLLTVFMVLTMIPIAAFAEETDFTIQDGILTAYNGTATEVTIPDGVTAIGEKAFSGKKLTSVVIPASVERIEQQAFYGNSLSSVTLSEGLTYIGAYAFDENYAPLDLVIPSTVTEVGNGAFGVLGEDTACSITFLNPDTVIPNSAVEYFAKLTVYGATGSTAEQLVNYWKEQKADGCKLVFEATDEEEPVSDENFTIEDGVLTAYTGTDTEVTVPKGVKAIGAKAFYSKRLTSVVIPASVERIEQQAFYGNSLSSVTLSEGLTYIGAYAFDENYAQLDLVIPSTVTEVGNGAFGVLGEDKVCSVTFLNPNTVIPNNALEYFAYVTVYGAAGSTAEQLVNHWKEEKADSCRLVFVTEGTTIHVDPAEVTLHRTETAALTVAVDQEGAAAPLVAWESSDPQVATVDKKGVVSAIAEGTATITAKTGTLSASCVVNVVIEEDESDYQIASDGTITGYIGTDPANLEIPEEISGITVTAIGDKAFAGNRQIVTVQLPSTVTKIGEQAFADCSGLTTINLDAVTELSKESFRSCSALEEVTLSKNLTNMPEGVFRSCNSLTDIAIPGSAKEIGEEAFSGCTNLSSIRLGEGITAIHNLALFNCPIPTLNLPASFEQLGDREVGDPFEVAGQMDADETMTTITVAKNNPNFKAVDGILYNKEGTEAIFCPRGRVTASIPEGVTKLDDYSFFMCFQLQKVDLPSTLKIVGEHVFQYDEEVIKMELPDGLETVGNSGFFGCEKWNGVDRIPATVKEIGAYGFAECLGRILTIPEGITRIETFAFWGYEEELEEIHLPSTLTYIADSAFSWAKNVKTLEIPEGVTYIGKDAFARTDALVSVSLPSTLTEIGTHAFMGPTQTENLLQTIEIPSSVTTFGDEVFQNREATLTIISAEENDAAAAYAKANGMKWEKKTVAVTKADSSISLAAQSKTYTGKALAYTGKVTKKGSAGNVTLRYYSDAACKKEVKAANVKNAGTYYVKATLEGDAGYNAAESKAVKFTINQAKPVVKTKKATVSLKASAVKKKAKTLANFTVKCDKGKVSYSNVSKDKTAKKFKVNSKTGKLTIPKGTKKGTYAVKVKVAVKAGTNYKKLTKTVAFKVNVK